MMENCLNINHSLETIPFSAAKLYPFNECHIMTDPVLTSCGVHWKEFHCIMYM